MTDKPDPYHTFAEPAEQYHRGLSDVPPYLRYPDLERQRDLWRRLCVVGWGFAAMGWGLFIVTLIFALSGPAFAIEYTPTSTPRDAVRLAIEDCTRLSPLDQKYARYFWLPEGSANELAAFQYTLNAALSNAQSLVYGRKITPNLVAIDLRNALPDSTDFTRVFAVLEEYVDPYFHVTTRVQVFQSGQFVVVVSKIAVLQSGTKVIGELEKGRLGKVSGQQGAWVKILIDGRAGWVQVKDVALVTFGLHVMPRPELDGEKIINAEFLSDLTQSRCPVFTFPLFNALALTTIDGGLYYQLIGVEGQNLTQALGRFGVDRNDLRNATATNRAAVFASRVTSRPRVGIFGFASGVRPTDGTGLWTATEDIAEKDNDPEQDPIDNLAGAKFTGGEGIFQKQNGFLVGLAWNNKDVLLDEVPPDIARDSRAPAPFHDRINGIFSCIRCHADGGYQDFGNDVLAIRNSGGVIFGDLTAKDQQLAVDQLTAQYQGDLSRPLNEARRAHAAIVFKATGKPYEDVLAAVVGQYEGHENTYVTPQNALRWLGFDVKEPDAVKAFNEIVPPMPSAFGVSPEDAAVLGLRAFDPAKQSPLIWRRRYERIYPDLALRAMTFRGGAE